MDDFFSLPATCTNCGAVFSSALIAFGRGSVTGEISTSNVSEDCPHCGGRAQVVEGIFKVADDVITILSAPEMTKRSLEAFVAAIEKARQVKSTPAELAREAEKISPDLGRLVRDAGTKAGLWPAFLIVAMVIARSCSIDIKLDANQLIDQLRDKPPSSFSAPPSSIRTST